MIEPQIPANEAERLAALTEYAILDTLPEKEFDDITKIAAEICGTPISLVSLVDPDRQWFKSHHGLEATETPRNLAFCAHAINEPEKVMVVPDASQDQRFHDNPISTGGPNVVFYAGAPLITPEGFPVGTLCVIDHKPREITESQIATLKALANQVIAQMELRKKIRLLEAAQSELEEANDNLRSFAHVVAHDLKAPLRGITSAVGWLKEEFEDKLGEDGNYYLKILNDRSIKMGDLIDGILAYSKSTRLDELDKTTFSLPELIEEVVSFLDLPEGSKVQAPEGPIMLTAYRVGMQQILQNLLGNAYKYNDKGSLVVAIDCEETEKAYRFTVRDNGPGIPQEFRERLFGIFETLGNKDRYKRKGTGIGLATVRNLVDRMGGEITIEENDPELGGAQIGFSISK